MNKSMAGPAVGGIVETALYVADLDASERFWCALFGAIRVVGDDRIRALAIAPRSVLLLFRRGGSATAMQLEGGTIPGHDGSGTTHLAFAIDVADLVRWQEHLRALGIETESTVRWERGGISLYFRDPDQHSVELATPGVWDNY